MSEGEPNNYEDTMTEITDRDPSEMTHTELYDEWREVYERLLQPIEDGDEHDELWDRRGALWGEMKSRTDAEPPECPECGGQSWGQEYGEPKACTECDLHLGTNHEELIEAVGSYWRSVKSPPSESITSKEVEPRGLAFCVDCGHFSFNHDNTTPSNCHYCSVGPKSLIPGRELVDTYMAE